jgi:hypothetical protein
MNQSLSVIESTWREIQKIAPPQKISEIVKKMIRDWWSDCPTREFPDRLEFKDISRLTVSVYFNYKEQDFLDSIFSDYEGRFGKKLPQWQLIEAVWIWYNFNKEKG